MKFYVQGKLDSKTITILKSVISFCKTWTWGSDVTVTVILASSRSASAWHGMQSGNTVAVNTDNRDVAGVLVHELRHVWQDNSEMFDRGSYITLDDSNYDEYYNQPHEVDAREQEEIYSRM